jgi:hypothetical protein
MRPIVLLLAAAALAGLASPSLAESGFADIPGHWTVKGQRPCDLGFSGAPNIPHGTITTLGFCPWIFSARPRWRQDGGQVVISNRRGDTLAVLAVGRHVLEGQAVTGETLSLSSR